tara:strand:+ start:401 stop:1465 length:1065 start_codon:yes stop_codon:yes gene_type:complete
MASEKQYAYYIQGNEICIVERDLTFDNNVESKEFGPGVSRRMWKSPITGITDGLELKYTYSPQYRAYNKPNVNVNKFYVNGWTSRNGYLAFVRSGYVDGATNWTSSPYSAVTSGTSGDTGGQTGLDYIVVKGSSRWNGLHRVQTATADGLLITHTRVQPEVYYEDVDADISTAEEIYDGGGSDNLYLANDFSAGDYIYISGTAAPINSGLFYVNSVTVDDSDTSSKVSLGNRFIVGTASSSVTNAYVNSEYEDSGGMSAQANGASDINIYRAYRDFSYILTDVDVMNDENDEIDLPSYLTKGLVNYIKARLAEDMGNMELKEYFMREYKKILERHESGKISGVRIIGSGSHAIR